LNARRTFVSITGFVIAVLLASSAAAQTATPASAQSTSSPEHSLTLAGAFGYLFAKTTGDGGDTMPAGWIAAIEGVFDGRYAGVVEFAGNYQSDHMYRTILAGGRFYFLKNGNVRPFAQLLAGQGRSAALGDAANAFTLQPGGGVDFFAAKHVGVRVQGDYDWRSRPDGNINGYRFAASIVIR
jgi:hypothetical protein